MASLRDSAGGYGQVAMLALSSASVPWTDQRTKRVKNISLTRWSSPGLRS